ncbi:hypothetical protein E2320_002610 [Naja naja]|nr:hypothetical protein E2320_002610 [Naja naja]
MIRAVTANLEGEVAELVTQLHDEDAPEMGNIDTFLHELRNRLEDDSQALQAEAEIRDLKQSSRPTKEYIQQFCRVAGMLRQWQERLLVYFFKESLDHELLNAWFSKGSLTRSMRVTR